MRPRRLLTVAIVAGCLLLPALPALANGPGGWVDVDVDDAEAEVGAADLVDSGDASEVTSEPSRCTWSRVPDEEIPALWWSVGPDAGSDVPADDEIVDPLEFAWYWMTCPDSQGGNESQLIPVPRDAEPVDPISLREEAIDRLSLPRPTIAMNPTGEQVVHLDSWLWIDRAIWRTHEKSVSAGTVTSTVTASPRRVIWDLGNGDTTICDGPGVPYDPARPAAEQTTDCHYRYEHTSAGQPDDAYQVTATVEWEVAWSVTGAAGGGSLPALFTSAPVSVRVAEMQALNQ